MSILCANEFEQIEIAVLKRPDKPIVIYGAGALGKIAIEKFRSMNIDVIGVCDSNPRKYGSCFEGFVVKSLEELLANQTQGYQVAIAVGERYYLEVKNHLDLFFNLTDYYSLNVYDKPSLELSLAYKKVISDHYDSCLKVSNAFEDELSRKTFMNVIKGRLSFKASYFNEVYVPHQYFNALTQDTCDESFVDAGAYIGDTLKAFTQFKGNQYKSILSLEPFQECFDVLRETVRSEFNDDQRIRVEKKALSNQDGLIKIDKSMGASSSILVASKDEAGGVFEEIESICLDTLALNDVTFIKMDIEGSELSALKGAIETIKRCTPKLAICVYHKPEDIFEIPIWIMNLHLNYKYYLRHHGNQHFNQQCETVFYAIPQKQE